MDPSDAHMMPEVSDRWSSILNLKITIYNFSIGYF